MASNYTTDPAEAMQRIFAAWPVLGETAAQHGRMFWKNQETILDSLHELTQGWFERRRHAAQTAVDATRSLCEARSPLDAVPEFHSWMMGSAERVLADGVAAHKHLMNVAAAMAAQVSKDAEVVKTSAAQAAATSRSNLQRAEAA